MRCSRHRLTAPAAGGSRLDARFVTLAAAALAAAGRPGYGPGMEPAALADRAAATDAIRRGAMRLLVGLDLATLAEVTLPNGRRADLLALAPDGGLTLIEIKSSREDFLADRKWADYLEFADRFYFAVAPGFPLALLPAEEGVILADRFAGIVHRPARHRPVMAARRRSLLLRFARLGALRLHGLADPEALAGREA